ncbi:MAG: tRNA pseudouridine(38-40) synthase TruA [Ferruginibacter sp.]
MPRYFIEVLYKGTRYSGFQIQRNANSVQAEVEKSLKIFFKLEIALTGSSRTDAGVHALCNYFHFDCEDLAAYSAVQLQKAIYNLNAILPVDIVVKKISQVAGNAHCRFDAISREYKYFIYQHKDPFKSDIAYYYPYKVNIVALNQAAAAILSFRDFTSFSKRNTQVGSFDCNILKCEWQIEAGLLVFNVISNRFLRGMVRGLVGTMLKVGTGKISLSDFITIIEGRDCSKADFSVPPQGLFLINIKYNR